jgi:hypothetical protein
MAASRSVHPSASSSARNRRLRISGIYWAIIPLKPTAFDEHQRPGFP